MDTLEQIIRQHVYLPHKNIKGWWPVLCKVCNDHGRKGKRAAFLFEQDTVAYHCFNCNHRAVYDPAENITVPDNMITVLDAFGVDRGAWEPLVLTNLDKRQDKTKRSSYVSIEPATIELPHTFYPLGTRGNKWDIIGFEYLKMRGIDPRSYTFYLADSSDPKWYGRIIIPIYKDGRLIFYQGRDMTKAHQKKYLSADAPKDNVLFGYNHLFEKHNEPLFVVEGIFDAMVIDGVATIGNELSDAQIKWLNKSSRQKVIIPDKYGKGYLLTKTAITTDNWAVSTPDFGEAKDVNEAFVNYGKLYVISEIINNIHTGSAAEIAVNIYCTDQGNNRGTFRNLRTTQ